MVEGKYSPLSRGAEPSVRYSVCNCSIHQLHHGNPWSCLPNSGLHSTPLSLPSAISFLAKSAPMSSWRFIQDIHVPLHQKSLSHLIDEACFNTLFESVPHVRSKALTLSSSLPHAMRGTGWTFTVCLSYSSSLLILFIVCLDDFRAVIHSVLYRTKIK